MRDQRKQGARPKNSGYKNKNTVKSTDTNTDTNTSIINFLEIKNDMLGLKQPGENGAICLWQVGRQSFAIELHICIYTVSTDNQNIITKSTTIHPHI